MGKAQLPMEGVRGAYNCSRSHILDTTADDFYKNLKEGCNNLRVYLYKQTDRKMNVTATSDETELNVYVWGGCDPDGDFYMCRCRIASTLSARICLISAAKAAGAS